MEDLMLSKLQMHRLDLTHNDHRNAYLECVCNYIHSLNAQQHFFHTHPDHIEVIGLFAVLSTDTFFLQVKEKLASDINTCIDCIDDFYNAMVQYCKCSRTLFNDDLTSQLEDELAKWNMNRQERVIQSILQQFKLAREANNDVLEKQLRNQSLCVTYELLRYPTYLSNPTLNNLFCTMLLESQRKKKMKLKDIIYPGVILFTSHSNIVIRQWAKICLGTSQYPIDLTQKDSIVPMMKLIFQSIRIAMHFENRPVDYQDYNLTSLPEYSWKAIIMTFQHVKKDCIATFLSEACSDCDKLLVLSLINETVVDYWDIMELLAILLRETDCKWIKSAPSMYLQNCWKRIIDDPQFTAISRVSSVDPTVAKQQSVALAWMLPLCNMAMTKEWIPESLQILLNKSDKFSDSFLNILNDSLLKTISCDWMFRDLLDLILPFFLKNRKTSTNAMNAMMPLLFPLVQADIDSITTFYNNLNSKNPTVSCPIHRRMWESLSRWPLNVTQVNGMVLLLVDLAFYGRLSSPEDIYDFTEFNTNMMIISEGFLLFLKRYQMEVDLDWKILCRLFVFFDENIQHFALQCMRTKTGSHNIQDIIQSYIESIGAPFIDYLLVLVKEYQSFIKQGDVMVNSGKSIFALFSYTSAAVFSNANLGLKIRFNYWFQVYLTAFEILNNPKTQYQISTKSIDSFILSMIETMKSFLHYHTKATVELSKSKFENFHRDFVEHTIRNFEQWIRLSTDDINIACVGYILDLLNAFEKFREVILQTNRNDLIRLQVRNNIYISKLKAYLDPVVVAKPIVRPIPSAEFLTRTVTPSSSSTMDDVANNKRAYVEEQTSSHPSKFFKTEQRIVVPKPAVNLGFAPTIPQQRKKPSGIFEKLKIDHVSEARRKELSKNVWAPPQATSHVPVKSFRVDPELVRDASPEKESRPIKRLELANVKPHPRLARPVHIPTQQPDKPLLDIKSFYLFVLGFDLEMPETLPSSLVSKMTRIPLFFNNTTQYASIFEPYLKAECMTQFTQSLRDISNSSFPILAQQVTTIDAYHELSLTMSFMDYREEAWLPNSLLYIFNDQAQSFLTIIREVKKQKNGDVELIGHLNFKKDKSIIRPNSQWRSKFVLSLTTHVREYIALAEINRNSLCQTILRPPRGSEIIVPPEIKYKRYCDNLGLNKYQAMAVLAAVESKDGFVLIQGPPGTGKTKTILGMIAAMQNHGVPISVPGAATTNIRQYQKRILVCAPSNAAIDEIARRLMAGILNMKGVIYKPKIIRVGNPRTIHEDVLPISLDMMIDNSANDDSDLTDLRQQKSEDYRELETLNINIAAAQEKERQEPHVSAHAEVISSLFADLASLKGKIALGKTKIAKLNTEMTRQRQNMRQKLISNADIVLCTLSGAASDAMIDGDIEYDTVIVDEACQATEVSCLIPLRLGMKKCVLVGDPKQLPPTLLCNLSIERKYDRSLFERLMISSLKSVHLLRTQYRMHPSISVYPNKAFYESKLQDAPDMRIYRSISWHSSIYFQPYMFFDVNGREEKRKNSVYNSQEVVACCQLVQLLANENPNIQFSGRIGIISFYKEQVNRLKRSFRETFGNGILSHIDINTVDGFQGQEKDIIILSCVRAGSQGGVGFLSNQRRMNVALTRAKYTVLVVGDQVKLKKDQFWGNLVRNAEERCLCKQFRPPQLYDVSFANLYQSVSEESKVNEEKSTETNLPKSRPTIHNVSNQSLSYKDLPSIPVNRSSSKSSTENQRYPEREEGIIRSSNSRDSYNNRVSKSSDGRQDSQRHSRESSRANDNQRYPEREDGSIRSSNSRDSSYSNRFPTEADGKQDPRRQSKDPRTPSNYSKNYPSYSENRPRPDRDSNVSSRSSNYRTMASSNDYTDKNRSQSENQYASERSKSKAKHIRFEHSSDLTPKR